MKYIINTDALYGGDIYKSMLLMGANGRGEVIVQKFNLDELEELNGDYINEHYSSLQDEAYQRGLNDAWEAARKIADMWETMDIDDLLETFGVTAKIGESVIGTLFKKQTANEAMLELKAYEEKQRAEDEIKVGDEVLWFMKGDDEGCDDIMDVCAPSVITMVPNKECDDYTIIESSGAMTVISKEQIYKKTGRHFDIDKILEDMRND